MSWIPRPNCLAVLLGATAALPLAGCAASDDDPPTRIAASGSTLAGVDLTPAQKKWIDYTHREVVDRVPGGARAAALVVWWSLKEGVLDVAPNPWRHNLCGANVPKGDLETCPGQAWQVGLAGIQPGNVALGDVEAMAERLYPDEPLATLLGRIADEGGVGGGARDAIANATDDLRKAWLLRDPAIGIALQVPFVEQECFVAGAGWCFGDWPQARSFARDGARAREVVAALEARFSGAVAGGTGEGATAEDDPEPRRERKRRRSPEGAAPGEPAPIPVSSCIYGAGLYCGGNTVPGDPAVLYDCRDGMLTPVERCARGCEEMPPRVHDRCRA